MSEELQSVPDLFLHRLEGVHLFPGLSQKRIKEVFSLPLIIFQKDDPLEIIEQRLNQADTDYGIVLGQDDEVQGVIHRDTVSELLHSPAAVVRPHNASGAMRKRVAVETEEASVGELLFRFLKNKNPCVLILDTEGSPKYLISPETFAKKLQQLLGHEEKQPERRVAV